MHWKNRIAAWRLVVLRRSGTLALLAVLAVTLRIEAQQVCTQCARCGKAICYTPRQQTYQQPVRRNYNAVSSAQALAQQEVDNFVRRGRGFYRSVGGHYIARGSRMSAVGGRFAGTGWTTGGGMPGTCTPRRGMQLIADAVARAVDGTIYRCRIWR